MGALSENGGAIDPSLSGFEHELEIAFWPALFRGNHPHRERPEGSFFSSVNEPERFRLRTAHKIKLFYLTARFGHIKVWSFTTQASNVSKLVYAALNTFGFRFSGREELNYVNCK